MRFPYVSDIHLEFLSENEIINIESFIKPCCDVLVLAGDIGNPYNIFHISH